MLGGGWSVVSALRADRIALDVRNHRAVTATNPALFTTRFSPVTGRLGLVKDLSADWQVYAQASTAADPPSSVLATAGFSALRNFDLTTGRQVELVDVQAPLRHRPRRKRLNHHVGACPLRPAPLGLPAHIQLQPEALERAVCVQAQVTSACQQALARSRRGAPTLGAEIDLQRHRPGRTHGRLT